MPKMAHVVLFTFHAYGTWMPDRPQGYFKGREGYRHSDPAEAEAYRDRQREHAADLAADAQRAMIGELLVAADHQHFALYGAASDDSHLHLVVGWDDDRTPERVQNGVKTSISRRLVADFGRRQWLGRNGHDRRVRDRAHFLHLRDVYLPDHRGWRWDRQRGWTPPRPEGADESPNGERTG